MGFPTAEHGRITIYSILYVNIYTTWGLFGCDYQKVKGDGIGWVMPPLICP
jgi:hypothetical protein